jgi:hypothetical protein
MTVFANVVFDDIIADRTLDHRNIQPVRRLAPATADASNLTPSTLGVAYQASIVFCLSALPLVRQVKAKSPAFQQIYMNETPQDPGGWRGGFKNQASVRGSSLRSAGLARTASSENAGVRTLATELEIAPVSGSKNRDSEVPLTDSFESCYVPEVALLAGVAKLAYAANSKTSANHDSTTYKTYRNLPEISFKPRTGADFSPIVLSEKGESY